MAHLDGYEQHLVQREEDRDLDDDRQAAGQRICTDTLVERHHLLLLAGLVVGKTLAKFLDLGLQELHLAHRVVGFVGEREEQQLDTQGEQQDRQAKITENLVEELERQKDWLRQEVEPAEIDSVIEERNPGILVGVEEINFFSSGKETGGRLGSTVGRNRDFRAKEIGLIAIYAGIDRMGKARLDPFVLRRDQCS